MQEQQPQGGAAEGASSHERQNQQRLKVISIRVDEAVHAQLQFIAQLTGSSITEEIRTAIDQRLATAQDDPDLIARAQQARDEIEREAAARSAAIAGFMGGKAVAATNATAAKTARPTARPAGK